MGVWLQSMLSGLLPSRDNFCLSDWVLVIEHLILAFVVFDIFLQMFHPVPRPMGKDVLRHCAGLRGSVFAVCGLIHGSPEECVFLSIPTHKLCFVGAWLLFWLLMLKFEHPCSMMLTFEHPGSVMLKFERLGFMMLNWVSLACLLVWVQLTMLVCGLQVKCPL